MRPVRPEPPPRGPTPRAQLTRVVVAGAAAIVLGAGPAIAWDLSTQPPRAEPPTGWPRPSPWLAAARQAKAAMGGIARIYVPKDPAAPPGSSEPLPPPGVPAPATTATTVASSRPTMMTVPVPYRVPRR